MPLNLIYLVYHVQHLLLVLPQHNSMSLPTLGAFAHFFSNATPVLNKCITTNPISIYTPSGIILSFTYEADLDVPGLPRCIATWTCGTKVSHTTLIHFGQFCDARCAMVFTATDVIISHDNQIILQGVHTPTTKLWQLNIQPNHLVAFCKPLRDYCKVLTTDRQPSIASNSPPPGELPTGSILTTDRQLSLSGN